MFPVEIDGIVYPCFFKTQGQAMVAAQEYFDSINRGSYGFNIVRAKTNHGNVYYVVKGKDGQALPLTLEAEVF
ncbi:hypothetical protein ACIPZ5_17780 [Pseudomonas sp. NPDC089428]|uniref:hypothetical protein n=1 Tax=Pseudomonas sp. NPDC089428 TaxID=3364467 RepID=UPI00381A952B